MNTLVILLLLVAVCLGNSISEEIQKAQSLLLTDGPSAGVLNEFNRVIAKLEANKDETNTSVENSSLSQFYFKKSLIEINLNKERDAIKTLHKCLSLDPSLKPARTKLLDLSMEFSLFEDPIFSEADNTVKQKIDIFYSEYTKMVEEVGKGNFQSALDIIDTELLPVSPSNATIYKYKIDCLQHIQSSGSDTDAHAISRDIIHSYSKLIKLESVRSLSNYKHLSDYLLFTQVSFDKAFANVKQCLRIDNEFADCIKLSKFYSKFKQLFEQLEIYSIESSHIYLDNEVSGSHPSIEYVDLNDKIDFGFVTDFLSNGKPTKRQLAGLSNINSNYDYLMHFIKDFKDSTSLSEDPQLLVDLNRLVCESYVQTNNYNMANKVCGEIKDEKFLPKYIPKIDKLLSQQKYGEVDQIMKKFPVNTRQTQLFKSRYEKVEAYLNEQQRKQQQQQQQQQQRFYQQQQQRQQQQYRQAPPPSKPKNDYYKVLDVSRDADEKTIKKAHRTQTLKYHPDKYKGGDLTPEQIEAKMQEVNQAYEVLSDPGMRERYDRGDDPNDPMGGGGGGGSPFGSPFGGGAGGGAGGNPFGGNFQFSFGNGGGFKFGGFGNKGPKMKFQKNHKQRRS